MVKRRRVYEKHGQSGTRLYNIWQGMLLRCSSRARGEEREYYYSRGIRVCPEWIESFLVFKTWADKHGYKDSLEIDRRNVDGPYAPGNCRWATRKQNSRNVRKGSSFTSVYKGVSWCKQRSKWRASINPNGRTIHLGLFNTQEGAARAYDKKARELYGDFAHTNFPLGACGTHPNDD